MKNGTVKFFNTSKGYGFILQDENPQAEMFFHVDDIVGGKNTIKQDSRVSYDIGKSKDNREKAINVQLIK